MRIGELRISNFLVIFSSHRVISVCCHCVCVGVCVIPFVPFLCLRVFVSASFRERSYPESRIKATWHLNFHKILCTKYFIKFICSLFKNLDSPVFAGEWHKHRRNDADTEKTVTIVKYYCKLQIKKNK